MKIDTKSIQQQPPKQSKSKKMKKKLSLKTHSRSRPGKRLRPKGVKPLKLTTLTHFQLFLKRPRAPKKGSKWLPQWSLWALKITKIQKQEHSKKKPPRETAKSRSMDTLGGVRERTFFDKITQPSQKTSTSAPGPSKSPLGPQKQAPRPQKWLKAATPFTS